MQFFCIARLKLIGILLFLIGFDAIGQALNPIPVSYREGFYNSFHKNPDSAVFYAQKLAEKPEYASYLLEALHSDFFNYFFESHKQAFKAQAIKDNNPGWEESYEKWLAPFSGTLLKLYTDTNLRLVESAEPLYLWAEVQRNLNDPEKITSLTKTFINSALQKKDLYGNRTATYAMLLYLSIEKEKKFETLSDELLSTLIDKLSAGQIDINVYSSPESLLNRRTWYRYVYACANRFKANRLAQAGDVQGAIPYFKIAAENGPDLSDLDRQGEYFNENHLFTSRQRNIFDTEYLKYLKLHSTDKNVLLTALSNAALRDPSEFKDSLKTFYTMNFQQRESFSEFWNKKISVKLEKTPTFTIKALDGKSYSSSRRTGKWMLIDFWGTWCGACREEHPDLQKFYLNSLSDFAGKIEILTVACHDTEEKVNLYMGEFNYSFPVAMADDKILKLFNVQGFPRKVLITPKGKYLVVPFGIDWVGFVKKYASL